jgi:hypothetical protein
MRWRAWAVILALVLLGSVALFWPGETTGSAPDLAGQASSSQRSTPSAPTPPLSPEARARLLLDLPEAKLATDLNAPGGTIQSDLAIVASLFAAYRSNYAGRGNPIGDNREITDTLRGRNPNGIIFLPPGHRAVNAKGELCDRWGTPLSFHAESGTRMEVRSAGPDRVMRTPDDVFLVP